MNCRAGTRCDGVCSEHDIKRLRRIRRGKKRCVPTATSLLSETHNALVQDAAAVGSANVCNVKAFVNFTCVWRGGEKGFKETGLTLIAGMEI